MNCVTMTALNLGGRETHSSLCVYVEANSKVKEMKFFRSLFRIIIISCV